MTIIVGYSLIGLSLGLVPSRLSLKTLSRYTGNTLGPFFLFPASPSLLKTLFFGEITNSYSRYDTWRQECASINIFGLFQPPFAVGISRLTLER